MCVYEVFNLIKEARDAQKALLPVLPPEEKAKHDLWFNAKIINVKEFVDEVNTWTQSTKAV